MAKRIFEIEPTLSRELKILALECHFYWGEYQRTGDKYYRDKYYFASNLFLDKGGVIASAYNK